MSDWMAILIEYLRVYGIGILGPAIIVQSNGIPVGANFMTMAAGAFAYAGEFNLQSIYAAVFASLVIGDSLSYWLWRFLGRGFLTRFPRIDAWLIPKINRASITMDKYGWWGLLFTRFPLSSLGPPLNVLSGLTGYSFRRYLAASLVGESMWASSYLGLGFWFGDSWEDAVDLLTQFGQLILLLAIFLILAYSIRRVYRKYKNAAPELVEVDESFEAAESS